MDVSYFVTVVVQTANDGKAVLKPFTIVDQIIIVLPAGVFRTCPVFNKAVIIIRKTDRIHIVEG